MALYIWECNACGDVTRRILSKRPTLEACRQEWGEGGRCGGKLVFVTTPTSSTKEVIDNGLMYKPLERDPRIEAQLKERNELAAKPDDTLV